jgi:hypothetical protein
MEIRPRDSKATWQRILRKYLRPSRPGKSPGSGVPEPVEPDSPKHLSGGAAAALEFDD